MFITTPVNIKKSQDLNMLTSTKKTTTKNNLGLLDAPHDANLAMCTAPQT